MIKNLRGRKRLDERTHTVRASQGVLQYGVGAMIDFPSQTLMTAAPEYWSNSVVKIHDERLEKLLKVQYFGMPGNKDEKQYREGISYVRFPEWYFCPKCRRFQPLDSWVAEFNHIVSDREKERNSQMLKQLLCVRCKQELVVARIITICENGHIDDFPWVDWVHCRNYGGPKPICGFPSLTFKTGTSSTEGLEGLEISCETCKARANLLKAFDPGIFEELDKKFDGQYSFKCKGRHPWKNAYEKCLKFPRSSQRGSSSVYFPVIASSLVIPPYSSMLTAKVESDSHYDEYLLKLGTYRQIIEDKNELNKRQLMLIDEIASKISKSIPCDKEKVVEILKRKSEITSNEDGSTFDVNFRYEEYSALNGEVNICEDEQQDFVRENTDIEAYGLGFLRQVSLIHKIREVQALTGFTRIKPIDREETEGKNTKVVPVKEINTEWYPAYQVRGEGIFIEFHSDQIEEWVKKNPIVCRRTELLNEKYEESYQGRDSKRVITPKFLLLHTIAHLLIKQLSFECGYGISSLKERIYCSDLTDGKDMSGILIYTASGDSEGTLGGLVRQGREDVFPELFKKAIKTAMTCSNDPVCILSLGQGRDSLNMAACYSCALIPETSCEEYNIFLDRGVVVGTFNNPDIGFFSEYLYRGADWKTAQSFAKVLTEEVAVKPKIDIVFSLGTNVDEMEYRDIWNNVKQFCSEQSEIDLFNDLVQNSSSFNGKEKPLLDSTFQVTGDNEDYACDMLWQDSKVALFTSENEEEYNKLLESDWKCFIASDTTLKWSDIHSSLRSR